MALENNPYRGDIGLASPGDLTIKLVEDDLSSFSRPLESVSVRVSKDIMMKNSGYLRKRLCGCNLRRSFDTITLKVSSIESIMVWLRLFHESLPMPTSDGLITVPHIQHLIDLSIKYDFDEDMISDWVRGWREVNLKDIDDEDVPIPDMLYATYYFNDVDGFLALTKRLVYTSKLSLDRVPKVLEKLDVSSDVIPTLYLAKGHLREVLQRLLFEKVHSILQKAECDCKTDAVFNYMRELMRIKVWPLDDSFSRSTVQRVLDRLLKFDQARMEPVKNAVSSSASSESGRKKKKVKLSACESCGLDWKGIVMRARETVGNHFDGLCLRCMGSCDGDGECPMNHGHATTILSRTVECHIRSEYD